MEWQLEHDALVAAQVLDAKCPLAGFREEFCFPSIHQEPLYFAGHSLGLMPKQTPALLAAEADAWAKYAVEGHLAGENPWLPYHEQVAPPLSRLVGAKESEVVAMNSLTANLHLMLVSFYRPTKNRYKILIDANAFPSDKYAVDSQVRFHGLDPRKAVVSLETRDGFVVDEQSLIDQIAAQGEALALVLLGNCNYLSGQKFSVRKVSQSAHQVGALAGFSLAHGVGNIELSLHEDAADFAVWCSYKYLNAGPGGIGGAFVHEKHFGNKSLPRFEGWWGHDKKTRFKMGPIFDPISTVEAWQLSNPPIFQLASLRASLSLFDRATMPALVRKSVRLTSYLEWLLKKRLGNRVQVTTPASRGSMLCFRVDKAAADFAAEAKKRGAYFDFREPDIFRITPAALYNNYEDVFRLVNVFEEIVSGN